MNWNHVRWGWIWEFNVESDDELIIMDSVFWAWMEV